MKLSGGFVLGFKPAWRKCKVVAYCYSEWPLRVQCDGQSVAAHTGPLYQDFLDSFYFFFFFSRVSHTMSHTFTHIFFSHKNLFFPWSPRDLDVANQAPALGPDFVRAKQTCRCFFLLWWL